MDLIGRYREQAVPRTRDLVIDALERGSRKHYVHALVELDVTDARAAIRRYRSTCGRRLSLLAWITRCVGLAVARHPEVHAIARGRKRVVFEDVDVSIIVESELTEERIPLPYVVRRANTKTLGEIHEEVADLSRHGRRDGSTIMDARTVRLTRIYLALPRPLRALLSRTVLGNPFEIKKAMGTVMITSVGMFGRFSGWPMPISVYPVSIALGGITRKPGLIDGEVVAREHLHMTLSFDHDVVDGAPCARFIATLSRMIEGARHLDFDAPPQTSSG